MPEDSRIFFNSTLDIEQNTNVYSYYNYEGVYDYLLEIDTSLITNSSDITDIFTTARYQQNSNDKDNVIVELNIDRNKVDSIKNKNVVSIIGASSSIQTFSSGAKSLGDRLVEIVAHKIFGHAKARAAIKNDTEFYQFDSNVWNHLCDTVNSNEFENNLFNQYVVLDRINGNDVDVNVPFDFSGLTLDFPLFLKGNLNLDSSLSGPDRNELNNGPALNGGTELVNGVYNIPILVKFKCRQPE